MLTRSDNDNLRAMFIHKCKTGYSSQVSMLRYKHFFMPCGS